jgi:phage baseplate assembly protein gpV
VTAIDGVVIGLVKDIDDPIGEGRIRVKFPWLTDDDNELSGWAPIVRGLAGKERGYWFMPELDDEALIAFEHGDFDHPFVVGFLHNGVDTPPDSGIDAKVRRLKTVSGHILEFDDRDNRERILLKTQGGHHLEMKDDAGTVELATSGGQQLVMKDKPAQIKLATKTGTSITIDDSPSTVKVATVGGVSVTITDTGGVSVDASSGVFSVKCLAATVDATSCLVSSDLTTVSGEMVLVDSPIVDFTGVVVCQTLIAQSVVSSSYTPGAGNIW